MTTELLARVEALEQRVSALEGDGTKAKTQTRESTPREFLLSKPTKSILDKTLLAGYYIETVMMRTDFDLDDLSRFFDAAKESQPANRRDPPHQLVKKGYFREVGERVQASTARNKWSLSNSGLKRVEDNFPTEKRSE